MIRYLYINQQISSQTNEISFAKSAFEIFVGVKDFEETAKGLSSRRSSKSKSK